ncbi:hypothetical protein HPB50_016489 [Hyalomma asiaticum]|uniref:Uncharacterized protein n=1 Tax=Hyalomma asiaticum TaxID=266040 RepID=A0ACB7RWY7_HYAAI|nr:hypothetical protein HPB50_016489 [Hyalomma asiaticum]
MNPSNVNMADDVRQDAPKSPSNNAISDINHDEAILAQEKEIEREDLRSKYQYIRKTRPDGNCFFRAFSFAYLESLLNDKEEYTRFKEVAENSKEALVSLGFQRFTIEDFHDTFMDVLKRIENNLTLDDLLKVFNDQGLSDYIVVYMRFNCAIGHEVEPMYKESDHIHIISLTRNLGVGVRVQYMDRGIGGKVNTHDFPEDREPRIHLLYRPGHYDILYHS